MDLKKSKKGKKKPIPLREAIDVSDERFATVLDNPLYRRVPRKEKRVDIDRRFQGMFHDKQFKIKQHVDKRGRPLTATSDDNLRRLYHLQDDDEDDDEKEKDQADEEKVDEEEEEDSEESEEDDDEGSRKIEKSTKSKKEEKKGDGKTLSKLDKSKLHSVEVDYLRGEGTFASEESSSSDSEEDEVDEEELQKDTMHEWGEMDGDASRTEESTKRLALCNMDWDRLKATDLMVLFRSFVPPGGVFKSVTIYPSEYGKARLAEEEIHGPKELVESKRKTKVKVEDEDDEDQDEDEDDENDSDASDEDVNGNGAVQGEESGSDDDEEEEGSGYNMEKLRRYQLNRLKYYYAVLEFDSAETADVVYKECDGMEYESSSTKIDLRFIPDDMQFDDEPHDVCDAVPDAKKYRPRFFTTTALQQMKVDLTWDETDHRRRELTNRIFNSKETVDDDDIKAYLASSDSDSDPEEQGEGEGAGGEEDDKKDPILKYKALLQSLEESETKKKDKDKGVEMEITWGVGLKEKTQSLVKKKQMEQEKAKMTPWEEMLAKRREKRQAKKHQSKEQKAKSKNSDSDSDSDDSDSGSKSDESDQDQDQDQPFSDDDVDVDMNDPFFKSELESNEIFKEKQRKRKGQDPPEGGDENEGRKSKLSKEDRKEKKSAELDLLLMDDEDGGKKHFSLKKIIEAENESASGKKKKNKFKKKKNKLESKEVPDSFEVNVEDDRFSALYSSHLFSVDPSDPNFKKTKSMDKIVSEKQKRLTQQQQKTKTNKIDTSVERIPSSNDSGTGTGFKGFKSSSEGLLEKNGDDDGRNRSEETEDASVVEMKKKKAELAFLVNSIKGKAQNIRSKESKSTNDRNFKNTKFRNRK